MAKSGGSAKLTRRRAGAATRLRKGCFAGPPNSRAPLDLDEPDADDRVDARLPLLDAPDGRPYRPESACPRWPDMLATTGTGVMGDVVLRAVTLPWEMRGIEDGAGAGIEVARIVERDGERERGGTGCVVVGSARAGVHPATGERTRRTVGARRVPLTGERNASMISSSSVAHSSRAEARR
jgi:hypothetical protein